jgi:hypothetical protein
MFKEWRCEPAKNLGSLCQLECPENMHQLLQPSYVLLVVLKLYQDQEYHLPTYCLMYQLIMKVQGYGHCIGGKTAADTNILHPL